MVDSEDIHVGTTSRILKYWEISNYAYMKCRIFKIMIITINEHMYCPLNKTNKKFYLSGLTFYINIPKPHNIVFKQIIKQL